MAKTQMIECEFCGECSCVCEPGEARTDDYGEREPVRDEVEDGIRYERECRIGGYRGWIRGG